MPKATGYAALAGLTSFRATQWFTKSIATLVDDVSRFYGSRNEVVYGLLLEDAGTQSATVGQIKVNAGSVTLAGQLTDLAAIATGDLIGGASGNIAQGIMSDGSLEAINLSGAGAKAYVSVIAINSDGSASTGAAKILAVISGTGASPTATAHLSTAEINSALAASAGNGSDGDHSGATGWCHVGQAILDLDTTDWSTITDNRNNSQGA